MRSVADHFRDETHRAVREMSTAQRLELARTLGAEAVALFARHQGLDPDSALRALRQRRQAGRRSSVSMSQGSS